MTPDIWRWVVQHKNDIHIEPVSRVPWEKYDRPYWRIYWSPLFGPGYYCDDLCEGLVRMYHAKYEDTLNQPVIETLPAVPQPVTIKQPTMNDNIRDSRGFRIPKVDWVSTLLNGVVMLITIPFFSVGIFGIWVGCYHLFRRILATLK